MSDAVLIGPNIEDCKLLSEDEYRTVAGALRLRRSTDPETAAIAGAVESWSENTARKIERGSLACFLWELMQRWGQHVEELQGMLVELGEEPLFMYQERGAREVETLRELLGILRAGGWLAEFLETEIPRWAKKTPTPLEAMYELSASASTFQLHIDNAKDVLRDWPQFMTKEEAHNAI